MGVSCLLTLSHRPCQFFKTLNFKPVKEIYSKTMFSCGQVVFKNGHL